MRSACAEGVPSCAPAPFSLLLEWRPRSTASWEEEGHWADHLGALGQEIKLSALLSSSAPGVIPACMLHAKHLYVVVINPFCPTSEKLHQLGMRELNLYFPRTLPSRIVHAHKLEKTVINSHVFLC